jgi:two-component system, cell cycle sensor histidine kinase and response regulator CckA
MSWHLVRKEEKEEKEEQKRSVREHPFLAGPLIFTSEMRMTNSTPLSQQRRAKHRDAPIRILLVDDNPIQLKLHRLRLSEEGFLVDVAGSANEALEKARTRLPDAIVSDVIMGDLDGFGLCRRVREDPELAGTPVILLSAHYGRDADHDLAARVGASALVGRTPDFEVEIEAIYQTLLNGPPLRTDASDSTVYEEQLRSTNNQLVAAVGQAQRAEVRFRALFDHASDIISILTPEGVILEANQRVEEVFGLTKEQMIGRHVREFAAAGQENHHVEAYRSAVRMGEDRRLVSIRRADGEIRQVEFATSTIELEGQPLVLSIGRDLTEKLRASEALAASERKFRALVERIPEVIWSANANGDITFITPNVASIMGVEREDLYQGGRAAWISRIHPDDLGRVRDAFRTVVTSNQQTDIEFRWRRADDQWIWIRSHAVASPESQGRGGFEGLFSDVTEKRRLEDSVRQSQKMEAIGQLTGGVAHDFNNILAVITANSYFLLTDLEADDPRREPAEEIRLASDRAAALTRQLLAFSRRQVMQPTVLDLNQTIGGVEKMLRRVIGEDIDLRFGKGEALGAVKADAGQIEQVLMNLVVNARDAMPRGGRLSITTDNVELGDAASALLETIPEGRYVVLTVSDTGIGMNAETKRHLFEPFFTTKEMGKGTGLGLSTSYGIVKQSGGHISVSSQPGEGTVFTVYLPRVDERPETARLVDMSADLKGSGHVLLIEDDDSVRTAVGKILAGYGYRVTAARDGREAVALSRASEGPIDLVLSDVILPGLSGSAAVSEIKRSVPDAKMLFMSGYTDHAILRDGALRAGLNFIQKPFSPESLARKIQEVLHAS